MNRKRKAESIDEIKNNKLQKTQDKECLIHDNFNHCTLYNCPGLTRERVIQITNKETQILINPVQNQVSKDSPFNLYS